MPEPKTALIFNDDFKVDKDKLCDQCMGRNKTCLFVAPYYHGMTICKDCLLQVIEEMDRVTGTTDPTSGDGR